VVQLNSTVTSDKVSSGDRCKPRAACVTLLGILLGLSLWIGLAHADAQRSAHDGSLSDKLALSTDSVGPLRFVAVHGRRAVVMGYPIAGLEVWGYPFQILANYEVGFTPAGASAELDGRLLLRDISYRPDSVTRTYIGPDFLVREKLFVPLDEAAAVIVYEVEGSRKVDIAVHFRPVLNLMWPAGLGGQYTRWSAEAPGYVIAEPLTGTSAVVGSPEIITHDDTVNSTVHINSKLSFSIRPRAQNGLPATAEVYVAFTATDEKDPAVALHELSNHLHEREAEAVAHYEDLAGKSLQIQTPDEAVNRAILWSEVALDQGWVCNPKLGCGMVAGYGPSRDARRPQYDWFFAGDGMIAANALVSAGEYSRARDELAFIMKYQDPATGMIWHELSQSAGFVDWSKYPYMYVHVDLSFDFLSAVARYVAVSGDTAFAKDNWTSISAAYRYCRALIRDTDHLPHIPADKEGGDEQARPGDDLSLSGAWVNAASAFAELANVSGHPELANEALEQSRLARQAVPRYYWNSETGFWIDGHTQAGQPIPGRRHGPTQLIVQDVFSPQQSAKLLDQLASADFLSDWGLRALAASSPDFDPYSYGRGSVSALGTTGAATTFWQAHRPEIAFEIWREVLPWNTLDSLGHIHELLAGSFYHEQTESVPEQTWSSAGLLDATIRGLLGIEIQGAANRVHLSPHLPAEWNRISVQNLRLPHSTLAFEMKQDMSSVDLDLTNEGSATQILFEPQIPLGSHVLSGQFQGHAIKVDPEVFSEDEHAKMMLDVPHGESHCHLRIEGGVSIMLDQHELHPGDTSTALKLTTFQLQGHMLSIEADIHPSGRSTFQLRTPWKITAHEGAIVRPLADNIYEIRMEGPPAAGLPGGYVHARAKLTLAGK
jgi:glycogen debranching enzyme